MYYSSSVEMGNRMGIAGWGWKGMKTLHFPISHPEPDVLHILLEERPALAKNDPIQTFVRVCVIGFSVVSGTKRLSFFVSYWLFV